MRLVVESVHLSDALATIKGVVERGGTIPILGTALLSSSSGCLSLTATNSDTWAYADIPCEGDDGALCLPLWLLEAGCIKGEVSIESDERQAKISCGRSAFNGGILPAGDFPPTNPTFTASGEISGPELAKAISFGLPAVSDGVTNIELGGVNIAAQDGFAQVTTTDRHRVHSLRIPCAMNIPSSTIPTRACSEILRLAAASKTLSVQIGDSAISVSADNRRIVSKLIANEFIAWQRIVRQPDAAFARFDIAEVLAALKRISKAMQSAALFQKEKLSDSAVAVSAEGGELVVTRPFVAVERVPAEIVGYANSFGINAHYLRDALQSLSDAGAETISVDMGDPTFPAGLHGFGEATVYVMPMWLPAGFVQQEAA